MNIIIESKEKENIFLEEVYPNKHYIIGKYIDYNKQDIIFIVDSEGYVYDIIDELRYLHDDYKEFIKNVYCDYHENLEVYAYECNDDYLKKLSELLNEVLYEVDKSPTPCNGMFSLI